MDRASTSSARFGPGLVFGFNTWESSLKKKRKGINRASQMNKWVGSSLLCLMRWPGLGHLLKAQLGPGIPQLGP